MVQWDHKGQVMPYPSGILNRFYLAIDSSESGDAHDAAPVDESLSLSLMDDIGEDIPPEVSPSASQPPQSAASGRKRKGSGQPSSPTKKPTSSGKGKEKKSAAHLADDGPGSVSQVIALQDESQAVAEGNAAVAGEEESTEEGPDSIVVLIDGKWRRVAMLPAPAAADQDASPSRDRARRGLSFGDMGQASGGHGPQAADDDVDEDKEKEEDGDTCDAAVDKDTDTFLSFLERAVSSQIYVASLAEMTRSRCYCERQLVLDMSFFERAAAKLPADQIGYYMRHHIDAALNAGEPSAEEIQRLAFADVAEEEEDDDAGADADATLDFGSPRSAKGKKGGKGRKTPTNKGAKQAGRGEEGATAVDWEVAGAAVDAACVLLVAGCSRELHKREVMTMVQISARKMVEWMIMSPKLHPAPGTKPYTLNLTLHPTP